jgi:hypothetical protein
MLLDLWKPNGLSRLRKLVADGVALSVDSLTKQIIRETVEAKCRPLIEAAVSEALQDELEKNG